MSFLSNLFTKKKKPAVEIQDPVFGTITFEDGLWTFLPIKAEDAFMIGVDAPESEPSDVQRSFFTQVCSDLPGFEQRAREYMAEQVEPSVDVLRVSTYSVQIGNEDQTRAEEFVLELCDDDAVVVHRVTFRAGHAIDYGFDD